MVVFIYRFDFKILVVLDLEEKMFNTNLSH